MTAIDRTIIEPLPRLLRFLREQQYHFVTPTPATHARVLSRAHDGATLRDAFGWNRSFPGDLLPSALLDQLAGAGLLEPTEKLWRSRVRVSSLGAHLFAHSAYPTIEADAVFLGPDTYRFVSCIQRWLTHNPPPRRAVDIGCGSGAAGIVIAAAAPGCSVVLGDINGKALAFAEANASAAQVDNALTLQSDILRQTEGTFDLIVANPPYMMDAQKRAYRDGGDADGAGLSVRILREALTHLSEGGTCLLYTGTPVVAGRDTFLNHALPLLQSSGCVWSYEEIDPDVFGEELANPAYAHVERIAAVLLSVNKGPHA